MPTLYKLIKENSNGFFWENRFILKNDFNVIELKVITNYQGDYALHSLVDGHELCKTISDLDINEYLFENAPLYSGFKNSGFVLKEIFWYGKYFPRIFRPIVKQPKYSNYLNFSLFNSIDNRADKYDYLPKDERIFIASLQQLKTIIDRLNTIFNFISPTERNLKAYGHELRNLILLTCTEVETQLKGILASNNYSKKIYTTKDFFKLKDVLKLADYVIRLTYYPEVGNISPFKDWSGDKPTESLFWYDNYNGIKHNREKEFFKANLLTVIESVCAVYILLIAQYGYNTPYKTDLIGNFFELIDCPEWDFEDCYIPPFSGKNWEEEKVLLKAT